MNQFNRIPKNFLFLTLVIAYLSACSTTLPPRVTEDQRLKLGKVGMVSIGNVPKYSVDVGPRGGAAGAVSGAGDTMLDTLTVMGLACLLPPPGSFIFCVVLLPPALFGGAAYGAISGAINATSEEKAKEIETLFQETVLAGDLQNKFMEGIKQAIIHNGIKNVYDMATNSEIIVGNGSNNKINKTMPVNTLLEVGIVSVNFINQDKEGGDDPMLSLQVTALSRLVDVKTKAELFKYSPYRYGTGSVKLSNWTANNAKLLKEKLIFGCQKNAEDIVEEIFLTMRHN